MPAVLIGQALGTENVVDTWDSMQCSCAPPTLTYPTEVDNDWKPYQIQSANQDQTMLSHRTLCQNYVKWVQANILPLKNWKKEQKRWRSNPIWHLLINQQCATKVWSSHSISWVLTWSMLRQQQLAKLEPSEFNWVKSQASPSVADGMDSSWGRVSGQISGLASASSSMTSWNGGAWPSLMTRTECGALFPVCQQSSGLELTHF